MLMLVIFLGIVFVTSIQPMFMVSSLIVIVLLYSYMIYSVMGGYWFSYVLMMVMLSGVLVVFTYMVSLIPNESFENLNLMYMLSVILLSVNMFYMWLYNMKSSFMSLVLWNSTFMYFNIFMISFLLSMMLMVVWLSYMNYGAMRAS